MRKTNVRIVLQARTGSKRLYGKVLLPIAKLPLVILCSKRLKNKKVPLTVAIPKNKRDNNLYKVLKKNNLKVSRGSLNNVTERLTKAARKYKYKYFIRISGDSPLIDPKIIDKLRIGCV